MSKNTKKGEIISPFNFKRVYNMKTKILKITQNELHYMCWNCNNIFWYHGKIDNVVYCHKCGKRLYLENKIKEVKENENSVL